MLPARHSHQGCALVEDGECCLKRSLNRPQGTVGTALPIASEDGSEKPEFKEIMMILGQARDHEGYSIDSLLYGGNANVRDERLTPPGNKSLPGTPSTRNSMSLDFLPFSSFNSNLNLGNHAEEGLRNTFMDTPPFSVSSTFSESEKESSRSTSRASLSNPWTCALMGISLNGSNSASSSRSSSSAKKIAPVSLSSTVAGGLPSVTSSEKFSPLLYPFCESNLKGARPQTHLVPAYWNGTSFAKEGRTYPSLAMPEPFKSGTTLVQPMSTLCPQKEPSPDGKDWSASPPPPSANQQILYVLENLAASVQDEFAFKSRDSVINFIQGQLDLLKKKVEKSCNTTNLRSQTKRPPGYWHSVGVSILQQLEQQSPTNAINGKTTFDRPFFPFNCPMPGCQRGYLRMGNLEAHVRTHLNPLTNFNAQQCQPHFQLFPTFSIPNSTSQSAASKMGGKARSKFTPHYKYACEECGKKFTRTHDLKRHARQHTNEKPFSCKCCKRGFARSDALVRHSKMGCSPSTILSQSEHEKTKDADNDQSNPV